jgi:hypothetical protein
LSQFSSGANVTSPSGGAATTPTPVPNTQALALRSAELLRATTQEKVFAKVGSILHWIPNPQVFNLYGFSWSKVSQVASSQISQFRESRLLRAQGDPKVYYINSKGHKKWIINEAVFNSYANRWDDIVEVITEELNAYPTVILVRAQNDQKVYLLENSTKRWIKTADVFIARGYKWENIDIVNQTEINAYQEGSNIE